MNVRVAIVAILKKTTVEEAQKLVAQESSLRKLLQ
jgi:hypothetical protein